MIALVAGVVIAGAGVAGLALTRHPVTARPYPVTTLPVPNGPIVAGQPAFPPTTPSTAQSAFPPTTPSTAQSAFPPTTPSTALQSPATAVSLPVALVIPSIGVQTSLIDLGLTAAGALQVPPATSVAGWYTGSPRPGAIGSAVIAGHIDSRYGPGVFFHLSQLRRGDRVYVRRADGTLAVFRVTQVQMYAKDRFPTAAVYGPTPDAELRLITCGGTFDPALRSYLSNTVVYAVETS